MRTFKDQNIIVTGGTSGIGKAITIHFLKAQARVIATYAHNDERAKEFYQNHKNDSDSLFVKKCDVTQEEQVKDLYNYVEDKWGALHVLVNNSGIRDDAVMALMNKAQWGKVLETNLGGSFLMSKYAISLFMKHRYGRIINISSVGARLALSGQANYAASKAGQLAMASALSKEVAKKGITVNTICPGFIETPFIEELSDEQKSIYKKSVPMRRFGSPNEVAYAVSFLASKEASYITGTSLDIAGGL